MAKLAMRPCAPGDASGINAVYNPFVRESAATFETEEYDEARRREWIAALAKSPSTPVFVASDAAGRIFAFANAAPFDPRRGYASSVKVSVFVNEARRGEGLARRLYEALFDALSRTDIHRAYALIVPPNPASIALHEAFGFAHVATLSEVGRKFERFHDVMWFEKRL